jgi:hypothetical protein
MIVSNAMNDVGCGLIDTDIDGLSDWSGRRIDFC